MMETEPEFVVDGHLGGYIRGGDPATYYPALWAWLVRAYGVKSVLDVGCGEGHALDYFRSLGLALVVGVDGIPQPRDDVILADFTVPAEPRGDEGVGYDLVWSCEVVEHVEERHLRGLLGWLCRGSLILMTHAWPGQPGHHHVNCQIDSYWVGALAAWGYRLDDDLTDLTRALAAANPDPHNHFVRSGLAFVRYPLVV